MQKIITEHFENLNYKMENLDKMCKFLDTHDLTQWNQKFSKTSEIEGVIKQSHKKEKPGLDEFTAGFLQTVKNALRAEVFKLFQWNRKGRNTSKLILQNWHHINTKTR